MNENELICPFCFSIFPPQTYSEEIPVCRDCRTFGRSILLDDRDEFLSSITRDQLVKMQANWTERPDFLEDERALILRNLQHLLASSWKGQP